MIAFEKSGDIFETTLDALVCPVNTAATMGNGLALAFKNRYPGLNEAYLRACNKGLFHGNGFVVWSGSPEHKVVLLASKRHWSKPSKLEWIELALSRLADSYERFGIQSLAVPPVGCGHGQLPWCEVRAAIYRYFENHPLPVGIFRPDEWA